MKPSVRPFRFAAVRLGHATILGLSVCLAACGGHSGPDDPADPGSSSNDPPAGSKTTGPAANYRSLIASGGTWTTAGAAADGTIYIANLTITPGAIAQFPLTGVAGMTASLALAFGPRNVGARVAHTDTLYYNGDIPYGYQVALGGSETNCSIVAAVALPPSSAEAASGAHFSRADYTTCAPPIPMQPDSTTVETYAVKSADLFGTGMQTPLFCITDTTTLADGTVLLPTTFCFETKADGTLGTKATFVIPVSATESVTTFPPLN